MSRTSSLRWCRIISPAILVEIAALYVLEILSVALIDTLRLV
jgi:hypothetical protein